MITPPIPHLRFFCDGISVEGEEESGTGHLVGSGEEGGEVGVAAGEEEGGGGELEEFGGGGGGLILFEVLVR
jgi:hypothetical protein